jgi:GT2 family glycosyltransferase
MQTDGKRYSRDPEIGGIIRAERRVTKPGAGRDDAHMDPPEIAVVVPTRDRPQDLERCLAALERQTVRGRIEVVVVDDGKPGEGRVLGAAVRRFPAARVLRNRGRGAAAARNTGAASTEAPLILLTDDDCEPDPRWVERLAAPLRDGAAATAGITRGAKGERALESASQLIADFLATATRDGDTQMFAASSNLGARAEVLAKLPFDEAYSGSGGEDRDWCARLLASGSAIKVVPNAIVIHHQELTPPAFWRKHAGYGRGARLFRRTHSSPDTDLARGFHAHLIATSFRRGPAIGVSVCLAQLATAWGYAVEALRERSRGGRRASRSPA